ncbi:hypothetical protein V493_03658 [Pseudogymnoascus sp. VKM F-4281 (FW-2241)]|nr:hypothetical protein V493_03658 [Pseudogymnoascus sp. VKM F-4281 (FW-2241)]
MRFALPAVALFALAAATPSAANEWTTKLTKDLQGLALSTRSIWGPAGTITRVDGPLFEDGLGNFPKIVSGLKAVVKKVNEVTTSLPHGFPGVELKDMYPINWAYDDFLIDQQILMNLLNLKVYKFSESIPIKADPLIAVINDLEPAINKFADAATLLLLPEARLLENKRVTLSKTMKAVVSNYSPKSPKVRRTFTA